MATEVANPPVQDTPATEVPTGVAESTTAATAPANDENKAPPNTTEAAAAATTTAAAATTTATAGTGTAPKELTVKHPLMHTWVLWYCKSDKGKNWEDCLKEVATFDTVEDFWALYNHIQLASGLPHASDYYLFKKGIMPMWEDPHNREGGRWLIQVDRGVRNDLLDVYWLELLMAMVGEQFDDGSDYICGAVVNIRGKGDKISLWTKDGSNEELNLKIGTIVKQKLNIPSHITYEMHRDTSQKTGSMVRAQLRV